MPGGALGTDFWVAVVFPVSIPVGGMVGENLVFRADYTVEIFIIDVRPPGCPPFIVMGRL